MGDRHLTDGPAPPPARRFAPRVLAVIAGAAFILFFHNFGLRVLPSASVTLAPALIRPLPPGDTFAFVFDFDGSDGDEPENPRSGTTLCEAGRPLRWKLRTSGSVAQTGRGRWAHEPGRIVFSSTDGTDPRTNGRAYVLTYPVLYNRTVGYLSALAVLLAGGGLYRWQRRTLASPSLIRTGSVRAWRWSVASAALLFCAGLYCSTGTLSPYANTATPVVGRSTGYLFNIDHQEFRRLFSFVDGQDRATWDKALLLRRILFPVLAWPLMKAAGFAAGGVMTGMILNLLGFLAAVGYLRAKVGQRGALFAAWLLALYPGAAYWGGVPYVYALIFPGSLLLMMALAEVPGAGPRRLALLSLGMGVLYLGYDFHVFFLPASLILLVWRKRPGALVLSLVLQVLPLALWLAYLAYGLRLPAQNSNTGVYLAILAAYFSPVAWHSWLAVLPDVAVVFWQVFFGSNFVFLPLLFLVALSLAPWTTRERPTGTEIALLLVGALLFLFNNLAPAYGGWSMRGSWIARLYQPVFPAMVFFLARWWQNLAPPNRVWRWSLRGVFALVLTGNGLIVFGPVLDNPLSLSETAFYRFYDHTEMHWLYEDALHRYGRRPIGFPRPQPPAP